MENKQLVHIASEVVIAIGLTFYFNQQNKKLKGYIEDLVQRVEEQEDLLQKHEQIIRKLVERINQMPMVPSQTEPVPLQQKTPSRRSPVIAVKKESRNRRTIRSPYKQVHTEPQLFTSDPDPVESFSDPVKSVSDPVKSDSDPVKSVSDPVKSVSFMESPPIIEERLLDGAEIVEESDNLDVELAEELGELISGSEISDEEKESDLKKRSNK